MRQSGLLYLPLFPTTCLVNSPGYAGSAPDTIGRDGIKRGFQPVVCLLAASSKPTTDKGGWHLVILGGSSFPPTEVKPA